MKIIIFGATGTLGRHVVEQALQQGNQVTGFARDPAALQLQHDKLDTFAGDVLDRDTVEQAMAGHDAVIIALGAGMKGGVRALGTQNVINAMQACGIRRLTCLSTLGAGDSRSNLNFFWKHIMFGMLLRRAMADHEAQEAIVRSSDLDWVIARPAAFADGPATGAYKHGFNPAEKNLQLKVSRADVAEFLLTSLSSDAYLRRLPGLSY